MYEKTFETSKKRKILNYTFLGIGIIGGIIGLVFSIIELVNPAEKSD